MLRALISSLWHFFIILTFSSFSFFAFATTLEHSSEIISKKKNSSPYISTLKSYTESASRNAEDLKKKFDEIRKSVQDSSSKTSLPPVVEMLRTEDSTGTTYYKALPGGGVETIPSLSLGDESSLTSVLAPSGFNSVKSKDSFGAPSPGFPVSSEKLKDAMLSQKKVAIDPVLAPAIYNNDLALMKEATANAIPLVSEAPTSSSTGFKVSPKVSAALNFVEFNESEDGDRPSSQDNAEGASSVSSSSSEATEQAAPIKTQEESARHYVNKARDALGLTEGIGDAVNSSPMLSRAESPAVRDFLNHTFTDLSRMDAKGSSPLLKARLLSTAVSRTDFQYEAPKLFESWKDIKVFNQAARAAGLVAKKGVSVNELKDIKTNFQLATGLDGPVIQETEKKEIATNKNPKETSPFLANSGNLNGKATGGLAKDKGGFLFFGKKTNSKGASKSELNKIDDVSWLKIALWIGSDPNMNKECSVMSADELKIAQSTLRDFSLRFEQRAVLDVVNRYPEFLDNSSLWDELSKETLELAASVSKTSQERALDMANTDERVMATRLASRLENYRIEAFNAQSVGRGLASVSELDITTKQLAEFQRLFESPEINSFWKKEIPDDYKKIQRAYGAMEFYSVFHPDSIVPEAAPHVRVLVSCAFSYMDKLRKKKSE